MFRIINWSHIQRDLILELTEPVIWDLIGFSVSNKPVNKYEGIVTV